ncbi:MAG: NgoPII family restriction endonuclease [Muribaculaceae bacterium]|nr:NgoPII family restriction endonuclease [Muribaculaceae bacterium]
MSNIINATINLVNNPKLNLREQSVGHNRANDMGKGLEEYIKDLFAGTVGETDEQKRLVTLSSVFSYLGNQNNPPDAVLKGGDAIEIKKIESNGASLALNSSYPKAKLFSDSPMISTACRDCEVWKVKDMIYAIGIVPKGKGTLSSLAMVYGDDYCAERAVYEKIKNVIKNGVQSIPNVEFAETNELGRVNRVDPLGITYLRVRGMWGIENPFSVFDYIFKRDFSKRFNFMCIVNEDKWNTFNNTSELLALAGKIRGLTITDKQIKSPNNPAQLKNVKLITFVI